MRLHNLANSLKIVVLGLRFLSFTCFDSRFSHNLGGTIAFHKKVTMKTLHTLRGMRRMILNYTPTRKITYLKGCELMRLSDVQPKINFSYIFVQFPGMKMNVPMSSGVEGKAVKEDVALCVQVNRKEKVNDVYLVRTQSIKPFDFTDEGIGAKASYRVIKQKENSQDSHTTERGDFVTFITDEVNIVQKKTKNGFNFILVVNKREIGIVASIEEEVFQTVKESLPVKEEVKDQAAVNTASRKNIAVFVTRKKKRIFLGGNAFQENEVFDLIRIAFEGVKRKVKVFSPAALDFIGPGDQNNPILVMRGC
jgi:hypothetical protein